MSENMNGRTDGCRLESHPISSQRAFGSGKLKMGGGGGMLEGTILSFRPK